MLEEGQNKKDGKAKQKTRSKVEVGLDLGKEVGKEALASEGLVILQSMFGDVI